MQCGHTGQPENDTWVGEYKSDAAAANGTVQVYKCAYHFDAVTERMFIEICIILFNISVILRKKIERKDENCTTFRMIRSFGCFANELVVRLKSIISIERFPHITSFFMHWNETDCIAHARWRAHENQFFGEVFFFRFFHRAAEQEREHEYDIPAASSTPELGADRGEAESVRARKTSNRRTKCMKIQTNG